jgi:hypothetical protein
MRICTKSVFIFLCFFWLSSWTVFCTINMFCDDSRFLETFYHVTCMQESLSTDTHTKRKLTVCCK